MERHIPAGADIDGETCLGPLQGLDYKCVDANTGRLQLHWLALAGQFVCGLPVDLLG